jgi:hypothetical protein
MALVADNSRPRWPLVKAADVTVEIGKVSQGRSGDAHGLA